jgi:hypothetical protein
VAGVADWRLREVEWEGVSVPGWLVRVEAGSDRELGVEVAPGSAMAAVEVLRRMQGSAAAIL